MTFSLQLRTALTITIGLLLTVGCTSYSESARPQTPATNSEDRLATLLANMPMNDGETCMGISLVIEALHAATFDDTRRASFDEIADLIFHKPPGVNLTLPTIDLSAENLGTLSEKVTARYQAEFGDVVANYQGEGVATIASFAELTAILGKDSDGLKVFCGNGTRVMANGQVKESHHAFLIHKVDQRLFIYDSNDPQGVFTISPPESAAVFIVTWKCQLRDEGECRNYYRLLDKDVVFSDLRAQR